MRLVVEPRRACTGLRFTFQRRLVTLWAWLMRFPDCGFLPQISHCCAMTAVNPFRGLGRNHYSTGFGRLATIRGGRIAGSFSEASPQRTITTANHPHKGREGTRRKIHERKALADPL